jgi:hypothetical protein
MGKSSPAAPEIPDPVKTAQAQGAANIESAKATTMLGNPNIVNPYGSTTTQYGTNAFFAANPEAAKSFQSDSYGLSAEDYAKLYSKDRPGMANAYSEYTPYVTQSLNPESQKIVDAQQKTKLQLADLSNLGAQNASKVLNTPFAFNGPAANTTIANAGAISQGPNAANFMAGGGPNPNEFKAGAGPSAANFMAGNAPNAANFLAATGLNTSNVAAMPINAGTTAQQAIMARLEPQLARNRVSTETQLINQGLRPGSEAYNNAATLLGQQENDQRTQAVLQGLGLDMSANAQGYGQAVTAGQFGNQAQGQNFGQSLAGQTLTNQAQAQNFGQGNIQQGIYNQAQAQNFGQGTTAQGTANQAAGQNYTQNANTIAQNNAAQQQKFAQNTQQAAFENQARQQALAEAIQQRQMPLNEISALVSGSQITNPQFQAYQGANIAAAPIAQTTQNAYNAAQNNYNQQVATQNANTAGLYSLGSAAIGLSDRRLKTNIKRIGTHKLGVGIYEYDILGKHDVGVMAQEVIHVLPEAIHIHPSGYMMVDYGRLNA